jgi:hypothetical protein
MTDISYRGHRFPPILIQHAVWLYLRFTLSYPEMWRSFSDGAKERQETGAGLRHRYLVSENPRYRRQKSVRIAICALLVSFGRLSYYSLEISAHCGCCRTWHKGEISI